MSTKLKILLLTDVKTDANLIKSILTKDGIECILKVVNNRNDFIAGLQDFKPSLVLSDYVLPHFNGLEALEIVKKLPQYLPFIVVTGSINEGTAAEYFKAGATDYFTKEKLIRLSSAVKSAVDKKYTFIEKEIAEKALQESEEKFRSSFVYANVGMALLSVNGDILRINPKLCKILHCVPADFENISILGIVHKADLHRFKLLLGEGVENNKLQSELEMRFVNSFNEIVWTSVSIALIHDIHKKPQNIVLHIQDINEKKKFENELIAAKEKAEESDKLKTAFLQTISHEIRTPLNAIKGFAGLLNDSNLDPSRFRYYIDIINGSTDQLLLIMEDILSIAFIESGQEKISKSKFNLNYTLDLLIEKYNSKAIERNIKLELNKELKESDSFIESDETKINQILKNLVSNALKFTHEGHIEIGYTIKKSVIEFFVKDTGIGIPKNMWEKIFDRFFQIDNSSTRNYEGTGLGLTLTKAYVSLMNGDIWVESIPGEGSTFYFTIPYFKVPELKQLTDHPGLEEVLYFEKTKTILVVEDEDNNYYLIEEFLSDCNINVLWAKNGFEAIEFCKKNPDMDLVLMDLKLPQMNGYDATREIKSMHPKLPIIAITAYALIEDAGKAIEAGCSEFIPKPLRQAKLFSVIKKFIKD
jgi:PAS domain S-box-containing protein